MNTQPLFTDTSNYYKRYLNYAAVILKKYDGTEPFHLFLKKYFSANKKHGSKDRKQITSLCYHYFRLGCAVDSSVGIEEKLLLAKFLIEKKTSLLLEHFRPEWNRDILLDISMKAEKVKNIFSLEKIFPFPDELSNEINFHQFCLSFLNQPKLFIRIRPGNHKAVFDKLTSAGIPFEQRNENCLVFSNNEKVSEVLNIDKEAVVQDYNSQRVGEFLRLFADRYKKPTSIWDCCAASGGKSILAFDFLKNIELTVSDKRKSILDNLMKRFAKAGITNFHSVVADLSLPALERVGGLFDLIIADVPCSGSGSWIRNPEALYFFSKGDIDEYSELQQKIVSNVCRSLHKSGYLLYVTCSVFKKENEENVAFFQKNLKLELIKNDYLKGYGMYADTLFAALFKAPS